ncbi:MAG: reverse transcriptase domain-containing protein, partial [Synechococcus sp.]|nr:reverse transcriptase domain-containing protein [Synechococcus sp.]
MTIHEFVVNPEAASRHRAISVELDMEAAPALQLSLRPEDHSRLVRRRLPRGLDKLGLSHVIAMRRAFCDAVSLCPGFNVRCPDADQRDVDGWEEALDCALEKAVTRRNRLCFMENLPEVPKLSTLPFPRRAFHKHRALLRKIRLRVVSGSIGQGASAAEAAELRRLSKIVHNYQRKRKAERAREDMKMIDDALHRGNGALKKAFGRLLNRSGGSRCPSVEDDEGNLTTTVTETLAAFRSWFSKHLNPSRTQNAPPVPPIANEHAPPPPRLEPVHRDGRLWYPLCWAGRKVARGLGLVWSRPRPLVPFDMPSFDDLPRSVAGPAPVSALLDSHPDDPLRMCWCRKLHSRKRPCSAAAHSAPAPLPRFDRRGDADRGVYLNALRDPEFHPEVPPPEAGPSRIHTATEQLRSAHPDAGREEQAIFDPWEPWEHTDPFPMLRVGLPENARADAGSAPLYADDDFEGSELEKAIKSSASASAPCPFGGGSFEAFKYLCVGSKAERDAEALLKTAPPPQAAANARRRRRKRNRKRLSPEEAERLKALLDAASEARRACLNAVHCFFVNLQICLHIPTQWRLSALAPLFKHNGLMKLRINWRPITLIRTSCKIFSAMVKNRFAGAMEEAHKWPRSHFGFWSGGQCAHAILAVRWILAEAARVGETVVVCFVDIRKAYDTVPRDVLMDLLWDVGVPPGQLELIRQLHLDEVSRVVLGGSAVSEEFARTSGLKQGCNM